MTVPFYDIAVIGAGPAGISAATTAADLGLKVLLLDEQAQAGGQIYRNVANASQAVMGILGSAYSYGRVLTSRLAVSNVECLFGALVWDVDEALTLAVQQAGRSFKVRAGHLIIATGAVERASPMPGWTLPGVMNAGAAQIAMKSSAAIPSGKVVLAGGGPLLLLVASQLQKAGANVAGLVETSPGGNRWQAARHLPAALGAWDYLAKGASMVRHLRKARVPWFKEATELRAEGVERATALAFTSKGRGHRLEADLVLVHHGVVPNTQLTRLLRLEHDWNPVQLAWSVRTDPWGATSRAGVSVAGDGVAIAGALAAEHAGAIAALGAAQVRGFVSVAERDQRARPHQQALARELLVRPLLDTLYRPPSWLQQPADDTLVCRCEEVSAGRIREMAQLGCHGPNQMKFMSRCGMGPCQGRVCGLAVTQILADALGKPPQEIGAYRIRTPLKPIPLASLANIATAEDVSTPQP
ncbi:NAD(P)/FAD-dependent oxidoreductase [Roseateles flavus]|uniref:NAD(P)/FAD-dependent oxidoreductase n=1 Tax=Roseateles flavus TaxID=3149041 RepID=A0ABV0GKQ3_9BURK